jgi:hypothetical protein
MVLVVYGFPTQVTQQRQQQQQQQWWQRQQQCCDSKAVQVVVTCSNYASGFAGMAVRVATGKFLSGHMDQPCVVELQCRCIWAALPSCKPQRMFRRALFCAAQYAQFVLQAQTLQCAGGWQPSIKNTLKLHIIALLLGCCRSRRCSVSGHHRTPPRAV